MRVVDSDIGSSSGRNERLKILVDPSGDAPSPSPPGESADSSRRMRRNSANTLAERRSRRRAYLECERGQLVLRMKVASLSAPEQPNADRSREHAAPSRSAPSRRTPY